MKNKDFGYEQNRGNEENGEFFGAAHPEEDISGVVENLSKPRTMIFSVLSLALGIISIPLSLFGGWFGLGFGVLAIVFSVISRLHLGYFDGKSIVGLVFGISGTVFGIAVVILFAMLENGVFFAYLSSMLPAAPSGGELPGNMI